MSWYIKYFYDTLSIMSCNLKLFQYEYLNECGNFPREDILHSMYICAGHQKNAEVHLQTGNLQHYVNHIWAEKEISTSANPFVFTDLTNPEVCHSYSTSVITHGDFQKMIKDRNIPVEVSCSYMHLLTCFWCSAHLPVIICCIGCVVGCS